MDVLLSLEPVTERSTCLSNQGDTVKVVSACFFPVEDRHVCMSIAMLFNTFIEHLLFAGNCLLCHSSRRTRQVRRSAPEDAAGFWAPFLCIPQIYILQLKWAVRGNLLTSKSDFGIYQ